MIQVGKYDYVDEGIVAERFPLIKSDVTRLNTILVRFGRSIYADDVSKKLDSLGLQPSTLPELLALGCAYPSTQLAFKIFAFGSICPARDASFEVPYLGDRNEKQRGLYLFGFGGHWNSVTGRRLLPGDCRFAANYRA